MTILDEILAHKHTEVAQARQRESSEALAARADAIEEPTRGFIAALRRSPAPAIIAEIKRRSPSKGLIREDFDVVALARGYARGGAATLSVLTDQSFFGGSLSFLASVRAAVSLPLLRKDFVVDPYQVDEARVSGADAVLLIAAALEPDTLFSLHAHARSRGLDVLVEVHDEEELEVARAAQAELIGVNNRDLRSFEVDLGTTERLAARLRRTGDLGPEGPLLVAESGIGAPADIQRLQACGARAFLVGESLMKQPDVEVALQSLRRCA